MKSTILSVPVLAVFLLGCDEHPQPLAEQLSPTAARTVGVSDLGTLGGSRSFATDINDAGTVVGWAALLGDGVHAFRWTSGGGMSDLGVLPGGGLSSAVRVLNSGKVVGWSENSRGQRVVVEWDAAGQIRPMDIASLRGVFSMEPTDFNERGEVVGFAEGEVEHGWYWSRTTGTIDLRKRIPSCLENSASAINASGMVAGTFCEPSATSLHGFSWRVNDSFHDLGVMSDFPFAATVVALGINDAGMVSGWTDARGNVFILPYLWTRTSGFRLLRVLSPDAPFGIANAVSGNGVAVGSSYDLQLDEVVATAWPAGASVLRLDAPDGGGGTATAVNGRGQAVGWAAGPNHAMLWRLSDGATALAGSGATVAATAAAPRLRAIADASGCLADPQARSSRRALSDCVMQRR